ncbi:ABC transporter ATP-binding protein [Methylobacterium nigriterrae]|uniref:ABC transporter ATP-binding protein n=1 Tax=Methylobacterium nigriterrae TaxID=3127512 RepID=UPI0030135DD4
MIEIRALSRLYAGRTAVDRVSMDVERGEIAVVVGTSGSGKTTLLRMINRLVEPSAGTVRIDGRDHRDLPAHALRRGIGYAIQGHGLFPHRTVAENIATVPGLLGWERSRIDARVDGLLAQFGLDPAEFRDRMPRELSGGQQQRVGVARALAAEPAILLMDEPFGALDPVLRAKAQADLLAIQASTGTTIVLVTHDMDEAIRLGSRIAVMDAGRLVQYARPAEIVARPAAPFVEALLGPGERAFRLLALARVEEETEPGTAPGTPVAAEATLREALAESLWSGREALPVSRGGSLIGRITRAALARRAAGPR